MINDINCTTSVSLKHGNECLTPTIHVKPYFYLSYAGRELQMMCILQSPLHSYNHKMFKTQHMFCLKVVKA